MQIQSIVAFLILSAVPGLGHPAGQPNSLALVEDSQTNSLVPVEVDQPLEDPSTEDFDDDAFLIPRAPKKKTCPASSSSSSERVWVHKSDPAPQLAKGQKQDKNDKITGNKNIVVNTFKVKESYARAEMEKASADYKLQQKSNFPHEFRNNKGGASGSKVSQSKWVPEIKWGVPKCDDYKSQLVEYPIYWHELNNTKVASPKSWDMNLARKSNTNTPLRVVYAQDDNNCRTFCGVMGHRYLNKNSEAINGSFTKAV